MVHHSTEIRLNCTLKRVTVETVTMTPLNCTTHYYASRWRPRATWGSQEKGRTVRESVGRNIGGVSGEHLNPISYMVHRRKVVPPKWTGTTVSQNMVRSWRPQSVLVSEQWACSFQMQADANMSSPKNMQAWIPDTNSSCVWINIETSADIVIELNHLACITSVLLFRAPAISARALLVHCMSLRRSYCNLHRLDAPLPSSGSRRNRIAQKSR